MGLPFGASILVVAAVTQGCGTASGSPSDSIAPAGGASVSVPYRDLCPADEQGRRGCDLKIHTDGKGQYRFDSAPAGGYAPADLQSAYGLPANGGNGRIVAIFAGGSDYASAESDLGVYRAQYGLPSCTTANGCFLKIDENGGTNYPPAGTNEVEFALDMEMASATCPGCKIMLVEGSDMNVALATVIAKGASAFSFSELYSFSDGPENECASFGFNSLQGLLVTAALGDNGYPGARDFLPAACEGTLAVGGTTLQKASNARGWTETTWSGTGSGCSPSVTKPAWQTDTGCSTRTEGDVAAVADPSTGVNFYCTVGGSGWGVVGGTSVAAPVTAGALTALGVANGHFSPAWVWQNPQNFFDVTTGSNGTCVGSPAYFCNAEMGYDGPTGWGSPNGHLLSTAIPPGCVTPGGSYAESCTSCSAAVTSAGCVLTCASCTAISGAQNPNPSLPLPCNGSIDNSNGVLTCNGACATPTGSYAQSCTSCVAEMRTTGCALTCESCWEANGTLNLGPSLPLPCNGSGVSNENGVLTCDACTTPSGSYSQSCTSCAAVGTSAGCVLQCASCTEANGTQKQNPSLALPCNGSIDNLNGVLSCD
jgi:hypothetical protein